MYASQCGHEESVRALIEKGASLEVVDEEGRTALFYAAEEDQLEVVKALLAAGSSLNARDKQGQTALHYTMKYEGEPSSRSCWARCPWAPISPGTPRLLNVLVLVLCF